LQANTIRQLTLVIARHVSKNAALIKLAPLPAMRQYNHTEPTNRHPAAATVGGSPSAEEVKHTGESK